MQAQAAKHTESVDIAEGDLTGEQQEGTQEQAEEQRSSQVRVI